MNSISIEVLPNEILGEIFKLCVDEDLEMQSRLDDSYQWHDFPPATLDTTKSPWTLGHVSGRWRSLALSSPGLWTAFDINWPESESEGAHLPYIETRLSRQLERCGDQPLSISWYQGSCPKHILWLLCSKSTQWANVTLRIRPSGLEWFYDYRDQFPNISALHLRFEIGVGQWETVSQLQKEHGYFYGIFRNASNLRRLKLSGDYEVMPYIVPEISWKQLTDFTATGIASTGSIRESFFGVLPLLENVETCYLEVNSMVEAPNTPFTLPRLHTLTLEQESDFGFLTNVLVAPSLRSLNFIFGGLLLIDTFRPILHLLDRSSCHITNLSFDHIRESDHGEFLEFLCTRLCEGVRTLKVAWNTLAIPAVLRAFHLPAASGDRKETLLPHLQSLVILDEGPMAHIPSMELVDMLASRRDISAVPLERASRLQSLTIRGNGRSFQLEDPDAVVCFERLQRKGLLYSHIVYL